MPRDSKINYISRMNQWNELMFCMLVQIQKKLKVVSLIFEWLHGHLFSSRDPKICSILRMSVGVELIYFNWLCAIIHIFDF